MKQSIWIAALALAPTLALAQPAQMQQKPDLDAMFFQQFDTDKDGVVSESEFLKPTQAQFDHMDKNGDGSLDRSEVKAFNEEMERRQAEMRRQMQQQGMPRR